MNEWRYDKLSYVGDVTTLAFTPSRRHVLVGSSTHIFVIRAMNIDSQGFPIRFRFECVDSSREQHAAGSFLR
jgi:hypothetical protein